MDRMLISELESGPRTIWREVWQRHVHMTVAQRALELLDMDRGAVREQWLQLDDFRNRRRLFTGSTAVWASLTDAIIGKPKWRDSFNQLLRDRGYRQLNASQFREAVQKVVPVLTLRSLADAIRNANPFPVVWPILANLLAAKTHQETQPDHPAKEWRLLHGLLLAGYFSTCRLPSAQFVAEQFEEHRDVMSSLRGTYLRIPERIGVRGILDPPLDLCTRPGGPVHLSSDWQSPIVAATVAEANDTLAGNGMMHRMIPIGDVTTMPANMGNVTVGQLIAGRNESYLLYEYTVVTFLALSSIEYLLRTWASYQNRTAMAGISIQKPNAQPRGVFDWVVGLNCGADLLSSIRSLYDNDDANIRNRVLHGNLLEVSSRRKEVHLAIRNCNRYGWLRTSPDPYHPKNIVQHCLQCMERIDAQMTGLAITPADMTWTQTVMLTPAEIEVGHTTYCDFLGPDRDIWIRVIGDYLNAVAPDLKQFFTLGLIGWLKGDRSPNPIQGMVMGFTFEALYRLTIHLMYSDVTGTVGGTVQRSHKTNGTISHFQYRMLDKRQHGLLSAHYLARLVEHVPTAQRALAEEVIHLAAKLRNALSHGALVVADQHTLDGVGHILAKASQTLVTAGLHHFTQEAAYFIFENEHPKDFARQEEDWDRASETIHRRLAAIGLALRSPLD